MEPIFSKPELYCGGGFEKLVTQSSVFVDKSLFIEEMLNIRKEVSLITMPRRWGKSTNIEMLWKFLALQVDGNGNEIKDTSATSNYKLFAGGSIWIPDARQFVTIQPSKLAIKAPHLLRFQGFFPVIYIDFQDCKGGNVAEVRRLLADKMMETVARFDYLKHLKASQGGAAIGSKYDMLLDKCRAGEFQNVIRGLCELLVACHKKKVWILIDEYDAVVSRAYIDFDKDSAKEVVTMFTQIYESCFKGNFYLWRGFVTGIQYFVRSGMLLTLNNLQCFNILDSTFSKYYGINAEEIKVIFDHFSINDVERAEIKEWYNGYRENIGNSTHKHYIDKYNLWSVINYITRRGEGFVSYWERSSAGDFISNVLKRKVFREAIETLSSGRSILIKSLSQDLSISQFYTLKEITELNRNTVIDQEGVDLVFSYLFILGYLTPVANTLNTKVTPTEFRLPNKELITEFKIYIMKYYKQIFSIDQSKFEDLTSILAEAFNNCTIQQIVHIFKRKFAPAFDDLMKSITLYSYGGSKKSDFLANEDLTHSLLNYVVLQIADAKLSSEIKTVTTSGGGRADIFFEKEGTCVVIEVKYSGDSKKALIQAKSYENLLKHCAIRIFIGCNVSKEQEITLSGEVISDSDKFYFEYP